MNGVLTSRNGNLPFFAAETSANAFITWSPIHALELRGGMQYVGRRFANNTDTFVLPAYTIFDLGARINLTSRLYGDVRVSNLFDKNYALTGVSGFTQYVLGPPREVMFTIGYKF